MTEEIDVERNRNVLILKIQLRNKHQRDYQSFPYENHSESYKKLAYEIVTCAIYNYNFFRVHTLSSSTGKKKVTLIAVFLSKVWSMLHHGSRPRINVKILYCEEK